MFMANIIFMVVLVLVVTCYNQTFIINWNSSTNLTLICGTGISTTVVFGSLCSAAVGSGGNGGDSQSSGSGSAGSANATLSSFPNICSWNTFYGQRWPR